MGMVALLGAGLLLSGVGTFMQMQQASAAASMQQQAAALEYQQAKATARENYNRQIQEMYRQQEVIDKAAKEKKSDLARKVDAETAALRVQLGETGALGTVSGDRLLSEQDYNFGVNISRIEANRKEEIEAIQSDKASAGQDMANTVNHAGLQYAIANANSRLQAQQARTKAFMSFLDSGLQIGQQYYKSQSKVA